MAGFVIGANLAEIGSRAKQPDATPICQENFSNPQRYLLVSAAVTHLQLERLDAIFAFGLDLILAALREQARSG